MVYTLGFFNKLNDEFHFTLDPCSTHENAKCYKHFTIEENGLLQDWGGEKYFAILHMEGK
ncbi:DNA N-6-adenine-methyltransferase [Lactococcus garvieae]